MGNNSVSQCLNSFSHEKLRVNSRHTVSSKGVRSLVKFWWASAFNLSGSLTLHCCSVTLLYNAPDAINAPDDKTVLAEERMHIWPEISSTVILCAVCWMANSCLTPYNPWTVACQTPLSGFSKQEYWNGLTFPPSGDLSNPGSKPAFLVSPALAGRFFTTEPPGNDYFIFLWIENDLGLLGFWEERYLC